MFDLISIGGISMDFYFKGESLTFQDQRFQLAIGGKYIVDNFYESLGGGGANVAIGAQKHGLQTAVVGKIGNNAFKKLILEKLENESISYRFCHFDDSYHNISTILLSPKGERSIIHYVSSHKHLFHSEKEALKINNTRFLFLGNLPDISISERTEILTHAKKFNITTFVNLGSKCCKKTKNQLEPLLKKTDVLILNGHEFSELVKAPYNDIFFHENVVKHYIPKLLNKIVVITEGEKGSFAYANKQVYYQKAIKPTKILDTTGAGDGYTAAFISEFFKTKNIEKAMEKGAYYASKILAKIGAN